MKNLALVKPVVFVDLETTGLIPSADRIVEITLIKVHPDGREESLTQLINPGVHIPEEAADIHGIRDADVVGKPTFEQRASLLRDFIGDSDLAGFNVKRFDCFFLEYEFKRASVEFSRKGRSIIDVQTIYHKLEQRTLRAAYQKYCGKELGAQHGSGADARATMEVLEAQLAAHEDLPKDVCGLHDYCCAPGESDWVDATGRFVLFEGSIRFNFGKYKGQFLDDIIRSDPAYLTWIIHLPDFPLDAQDIILAAFDK